VDPANLPCDVSTQISLSWLVRGPFKGTDEEVLLNIVSTGVTNIKGWGRGYEDRRVQDSTRTLSQGLATSPPLSVAQARRTIFALAWKIRFGK